MDVSVFSIESRARESCRSGGNHLTGGQESNAKTSHQSLRFLQEQIMEIHSSRCKVKSVEVVQIVSEEPEQISIQEQLVVLPFLQSQKHLFLSAPSTNRRCPRIRDTDSG